MQIIFLIIVFAFAAFGAWTAGSWAYKNVWAEDPLHYWHELAKRPWVETCGKVNVTSMDSGAVETLKTANNTNGCIKPVEVKAKRLPRKASPKAPSGKTARKRSTKSGK